eukprot:s1291_g8.t1
MEHDGTLFKDLKHLETTKEFSFSVSYQYQHRSYQDCHFAVSKMQQNGCIYGTECQLESTPAQYCNIEPPKHVRNNTFELP